MPVSAMAAALAISVLVTGLIRGEVIEADICIYGGTVSGVAAAVQAARMGKTTVIAEFGYHLGGMTSGGLGATDIGNKAAIGGVAREFYQRVARHYSDPKAWTLEKPEEYFKTRGTRNTFADLKAPDAAMWTFEPHVAEDILFNMINEARTPVYFAQRLSAVKKSGGRLREIVMENGRVYRARMFIDATYEGDLVAKAGVSYFVGREDNSLYHETLDGIRAETPKHQFKVPVDPYRTPGDASSGLLPEIQSLEKRTPGAGDKSVQAYNFRLCYTRLPANRGPHVPPKNYQPARYELLARYLEALVAAGNQPRLSEFWNPIWMPNGKTDINNNGGFSTDFIGQNYDYPDGDYEQRARIWQAHEDYTRGFIYFLATSPRVPANLRQEMQTWGPAQDEFTDTGGWPHQLYIREARRMISDYVMTEHNCRGQTKAEDPVGLGAYGMDSHNCRRIVQDGHAQNEGDVQVHGFSPYPISYRSIIPKPKECENLAVPVCLSATHIAYGSIRMEPVFMLLGQSAATACALAIDSKTALQRLDYERLRARLTADKQVLEWKSPAASVGPRAGAALKGLVLDDTAATRTGDWTASANAAAARVGPGYVHDGNTAKGSCTMTFTPEISRTGDYELKLVFVPHPNRARNVPVRIIVGDSPPVTRTINERSAAQDGLASLGRFHLPAGRQTRITVSNAQTDGYVVVDGLQLVGPGS